MKSHEAVGLILRWVKTDSAFHYFITSDTHLSSCTFLWSKLYVFTQLYFATVQGMKQPCLATGERARQGVVTSIIDIRVQG